MRSLFPVVKKEVLSVEEVVLTLATIKQRTPARDLEEVVYFGGCPKKLDETGKVTEGQLGLTPTGGSLSIVVEGHQDWSPSIGHPCPSPLLMVVDRPEGSLRHLPDPRSELCTSPETDNASAGTACGTLPTGTGQRPSPAPEVERHRGDVPRTEEFPGQNTEVEY